MATDKELVDDLMVTGDALVALIERGFKRFRERFYPQPLTPEEETVLRNFYAAGFSDAYEHSSREFRQFLLLKRARQQVRDALK